MDRFPVIYSTYSKKCSEGKYIEVLNFLKDEWDKLTEPKNEHSESFHIIAFITEIYLILKEFDNAKEWSRKIFDYGQKRADIGEREFLVGKVAYESGDFEHAKQYFEMANQKSLGKVFTSCDGKYLKFFLKGIVE